MRIRLGFKVIRRELGVNQKTNYMTTGICFKMKFDDDIKKIGKRFEGSFRGISKRNRK